MDIRKLTDEELAKEIYNRSKMSIHPSWKDIGGSKVLRKQALKISRFTRQCVKDSQKELVTALKNMIRTHGMHGPCEYNNCGGCDYAYKKAQNALREAMEGKTNVA